jgi:hypothetical protein
MGACTDCAPLWGGLLSNVVSNANMIFTLVDDHLKQSYGMLKETFCEVSSVCSPAMVL